MGDCERPSRARPRRYPAGDSDECERPPRPRQRRYCPQPEEAECQEPPVCPPPKRCSQPPISIYCKKKSIFSRNKNMFKGLLAFLLGVYTGLYLDQNYDVPCVDNPTALYEKLKDFADKHRKP